MKLSNNILFVLVVTSIFWIPLLLYIFSISLKSYLIISALGLFAYVCYGFYDINKKHKSN